MPGTKRQRSGSAVHPKKRAKYGGRSPYAGRTYAARALANMRTGGFSLLEKKFIDYEYDAVIGTAIAGAESDPSVSCLNAIAQGDGESNRDGRAVRLKSLHIKGSVQWGLADTMRFVRILVVLDKQTNGAQLNAEDVLAEPTNTDLDVQAFRNLQYTQRFMVLKDMVVHAPTANSYWNGSAEAGENALKPFSCNIALKNIPVTFTGTTADVSTIADNSIHVIAIASGSGLAGQCQLRYVSRVRFEG